MFTLVNLIENEVIAELNSEAELLLKIKQIADENEDFDVLTEPSLTEAIEYVEDFCENLALLNDSEVIEFLDNHGIEVGENEPDHYVELMMDNHKCTEFKNKQYYLSDSLTLTEEEEKIYDVLAYALHV